MLSDSQIDLVCSGRHGDPTTVLGLHVEHGLPWLRAFLPGASQVVALDSRSGELLAVLERRHRDGLFEAALPTDGPTDDHADYRLQVRWSDGSSTIADDPYRFGLMLDESDLAQFAAGSHLRPCELLGALPRVMERVTGTGFAVWAPNASRVSLVGDFNHWDGRRHGMRLRRGFGVWEIFLPGVAAGAHYKYEIRSHAGRVLPAKADPHAVQSQAPPGTASIVGRLAPVAPAAASSPGAARAEPIAIYEVHLGSWRRSPTFGPARPPSWDELAETLPRYASVQGFTHIELMPIGEHPFDGSWGYQQIGLYAPTARFGDAAGLGRFVDRCHAEGLRVLLDWVPGHFPGDPHGLARFDGSRLYEGDDPQRPSGADWNTLVFNPARPEVASFLAGNALFWLERYGFDGLRIAAAEGAPPNTAGEALLRRVRLQLRRLRPQALTVGDTAAQPAPLDLPDLSGPADPGFDLGWHTGWADATLRWMARDPSQRAAHAGEMNSHAVSGRPSVLALSHERVIPERGSLLARLPGTRGQRFAQLRAYLAFMYAHPGRKLLFMGNEFGHAREWQHEQGLDWSLLDDPAHAGVQALVRDLNRLLRSTPALYQLDFDPAGFEWIEPGDGRQPVLSFIRRGAADGALLVVVCNFAAIPQPHLRVGVPQAGLYTERLHTDQPRYGGHSGVPAAAERRAETSGAHSRPHSLSLTLPAFSTVMFEWRA